MSPWVTHKHSLRGSGLRSQGLEAISSGMGSLDRHGLCPTHCPVGSFPCSRVLPGGSQSPDVVLGWDQGEGSVSATAPVLSLQSSPKHPLRSLLTLMANMFVFLGRNPSNTGPWAPLYPVA